MTPLDVLRATEAVVPRFEIVDSRIVGWKINIQNTIADNASAAASVLGNDLSNPTSVDLFSCGMVWPANALHAYGSKLRAGDFVLSGALASPLPVSDGDSLRLTIGGLGSASVRFVP